MEQFSTSTLVTGSAAFFFLLYLLFNDRAPPEIPRVGRAGVIGYIITAIRFTLNSTEVLDDAEKVFGDRVFALPTLGGWVIVLSAQHLETLRASNDTIFNQPIAVNEALQLDHTMNPRQQGNPYQVGVIRNELTKGISTFIPEILEETTLAMKETFKVPAGSEYASISMFHTMTHMMGRITNRAMLGVDMCRNDEYIHAVVNFAETLSQYATLLKWSPVLLRRPLYFILSSLLGGPKQPMKYVKPYLLKRLEERAQESPSSHLFNIAEFLIHNAPPETLSDIDDLAMRILNVNFGSIHTSSIYVTQALFEMAQMSEDDRESIRREVRQALEEEGGWNKAALQRFRKLDSLLREVGRMYGLSRFGMNRLTIANGRLSDGTVVPSWYKVMVNLKPIHRNSSVYPNPNTFDPFRFSKLRDEEDSSVKHGFTTVDKDFIAFGTGRHACPGRFFASMELKIMLAHVLLRYDFKLPDGATKRPPSFVLAGTTLPPLKGHILFKPRSKVG
ncbi:hypothetical protein ONZ45_g5889 [Pleurotus djamor]|nr:hypothetical protein ONZ45_g5889 [Pleurotus djamor]